MLPNDIRFAETKPLNEGRTSFLAVTCCYAPVEGLAGFAGWNWLAVRITVSLCCSFYGSLSLSPYLAVSKFEKYDTEQARRFVENRPIPVITTPPYHLCTFSSHVSLFLNEKLSIFHPIDISPCRIQFRPNSLMRGGSVKRSIIWHDPLCIPARAASTTQAYFRRVVTLDTMIIR